MAEERLTIETIAARIGDEIARRLEYHFAGTRVYIPEREHLRDEHLLVRMLGRDAAAKLCERFGGEAVTLPNRSRIERRRARILELRDDGMFCSAIAREVGVTERYVYDVLAEAQGRATSGQGKLL